MSSPLYIWLEEDLDAPWAWTNPDGLQGWAADAAQKRDLAEIKYSEMIVILPGQWVRMYPHDLPAMKDRDRLAAAGFAVEDLIAAPITDQHIVLDKGDLARIGVISHAKMGTVTERFTELGLKPTRIVADYDILTGETPVTVAGRSISPGPMGYAMDGAEGGHDVNPLTLTRRLSAEGTLNLATGAYVARSRNLPDPKSFIRIAAALFAACLIALISQGLQARAMKMQAEKLRADMDAAYQAATGQAPPANLASYVNRQIRSGNPAQSDFLALSRLLFTGLEDRADVRVDTIRFDENQNRLLLRLVYPNFEAATGLETVFAALDGRFQSGAVREQGDELIGEATLTLGAGS